MSVLEDSEKGYITVRLAIGFVLTFLSVNQPQIEALSCLVVLSWMLTCICLRAKVIEKIPQMKSVAGRLPEASHRKQQ